MKKESVRQKEARDRMKRQAAQVAATVGLAGGGTAMAANAFAGESGDADEAVDGCAPAGQQPAAGAAAGVAAAPAVAPLHASGGAQPQPAEVPQPSATAPQAVAQEQMAAASVPQHECAVQHADADVEEVDGFDIEEEAVEIVSGGSQAGTFTAFSAVSGVYTVGSVTIEDPDGTFEEVACDEVEIQPIYNADMVMTGDQAFECEAPGIGVEDMDASGFEDSEIDIETSF